jgi:mannose-6-phosphate isomerase-like protein (cupin superfamily)
MIRMHSFARRPRCLTPFRTVPAVRRRPAVGLAVLCAWLIPVLAVSQESATTHVPHDSAEAILRSFAEDYARDPTLRQPVTFAISLAEDAWWHVIAEPASDAGPARVQLARGRPSEPTLVFWLHYPTLAQLHRGEINALTAGGRGLSSDPAPLRLGAMHGYAMNAEAGELLHHLAFHFWTRGTPEIIPFDETRTRHLHGTDAVLLYYQPGFRSGWFRMKAGQHANADPRLQVNPFPTLLVITRGRGAGRVGGRELELGEGNAVLIPAGVKHEFWNPFSEPVEGLLLMFGRGA